MRSQVKKWGNSAAVRIPAGVLSEARIAVDQAVEVRAEAGRIILEPVRPAEPDLASLLDGITDANRHEAVETGPPQGRETW